jgi:hypothetical protein
MLGQRAAIVRCAGNPHVINSIPSCTRQERTAPPPPFTLSPLGCWQRPVSEPASAIEQLITRTLSSAELVIYHGCRDHQRNHACVRPRNEARRHAPSALGSPTRTLPRPGQRSESPQRVGCRTISCVIGTGAGLGAPGYVWA